MLIPSAELQIDSARRHLVKRKDGLRDGFVRRNVRLLTDRFEIVFRQLCAERAAERADVAVCGLDPSFDPVVEESCSDGSRFELDMLVLTLPRPDAHVAEKAIEIVECTFEIEPPLIELDAYTTTLFFFLLFFLTFVMLVTRY